MNTNTMSSAQAAVRHADVFQEKLRVLDAAAVGVVLCRTREPYRAIEAIRTYAFSREGMGFANWSPLYGWETYSADDPLAAPNSDDEKSPVAALNKIGGLGDERAKPNGFYSMFFPHFWLKDNQAARVPIIYAIKEYARMFSESKRRLILLCPEGYSLPSEIAEDVVILDFEVPSYAELSASLDYLLDVTFAAKKPNIIGDARARIVAAGMGMNQQEFETAVSRAIVTHPAQRPNVNVDDIVDEVTKVKAEVVNRSEVLEVVGSESMANVGGLENLKTSVAKRRAWFSDEARNYGIEAPKGVGLFGPPGTKMAGQPAGSKVLRGDGTWANIEELSIGEHVMSLLDDGSMQPVAIESTYFAENQALLRMTTTGRSGAKSYVASDNQSLAIVALERPRTGDGPRRRVTLPKEMVITDFAARGETYRKKAKLYTAPAYDLPTKEVPVDPHTLGVLLGDGCLTELDLMYIPYDPDLERATGAAVCLVGEHEVLATLTRRHGWSEPVRLTDRNASRLYIPDGPVKEGLRALKIVRVNSHTKFVPEVYMNASLEQRLALLAGLIDTDGDHENFYTTSDALAEAFHQLVYSVGGTAHIRPKVTTLNGEKYDSFVVHYSTAEHVVPTVLDRKRRGERDMAWKNPRNTAFKIEEAGRGTVYGFRLEGTAHRYITDDYLVTSTGVAP